MKKFITAIVLLSSTSLVHADYTLVPSDDSELSKLCIAAANADSREALLDLTSAAGISYVDLPTVRCNGMPITRFSVKYGGRKPESIAEVSSPMGYLLRKSDTSPLTELCAAALVSESEYAKVKESHFSNDEKIESEVFCNGVPLKTFARKYRNASATLVSAL
ncbi:MAG: hypothetical protein V4628_04195 [Pseudomonadota bacterium]